jgi:hypothetical protein
VVSKQGAAQDCLSQSRLCPRRHDLHPRQRFPAVYANGRLSFEVELAPGGSWHACLLYKLTDGDVHYEAPRECIERCRESVVGNGVAAWRNAVLKLTTSNEEIYQRYAQAVEDMAGLRLPIKGTDHMRYVPAAGACRGPSS